RPPKYYLIDFGISVQLEPGADRTLPEFDDSGILSVPQDALCTNIYHIGNLVCEEFLDIYSRDLRLSSVKAMVNPDPQKRSTMDEAVLRLEKIKSGLSSWQPG
ncbi:hypothetical protein DFH08DRAFT_691362, partial [Mycena albidolilacea]